MNINKFKIKMSDLTDELGYALHLNTLSEYNTIRSVDNKVLVVEGLKDIPLATKDCKTRVSLTFWLLNKQPRDININDKDGYNIEVEDSMRDDGVRLYQLLLDADFIQPVVSIYNVRTNYYNSDNNMVSNNQSILNFTINCEIYEVQ